MSQSNSQAAVVNQPALPPAQLTFLQTLAGGAAENLAKGAKLEKQQALIGGATAELSAAADSIKSGQSFELIEKNTGFFAGVFDYMGSQSSVGSFDAGGDPNKEFETGGAVMSRFEGVDPVVVREVTKAQARIVAVQNKLRDAMADGGTATKDADGNARPDDYVPEPMFGEDEIDGVIAAEIWQPLVRGRVIPENAVPDRYSEVNQTFKGASEEYEKRLAQYSSTAGKYDDASRHATLAKTVFDGMNTVGESVLEILADQFPVGKAAKMIAEIQGIQKLIADLSAVAFGVTDAALKQEFNPSILTTALKPILSGIKLEGDPSPERKIELSQIKLGVSLALQSGTVLAYMAKRDPQKAIENFAQVISTGIASMDGDGSKYYADIGANLVSSTKLAGKIKTATEAAKGGDYEAAVKDLCEGVAGVAIEVINEKIRDRVTAEDKESRAGKDETSDEKKAANKERDKTIKEQQEAFDAIVEATASAPEAIAAVVTNEGKIRELLEAQAKSAELADVKKNWAKLAPEQKASIIRMQRAQTATLMQDNEVQLNEARDKFTALTQSDNPSDIDKLIASVKLQQARYTLAIKLASLPFAAIGAMFPPAKMGESLLQLANEMRLLIDCGQQYLSWAQNMDDSRRAGSVQAEAMASRVDQSLTQSVRHGVESAIKVAQIIGQGMTIAGGPVAHAGLMLDKMAAGASAAKGAISAVVDAREAAAGWRIYQKAFEDPKNRTAARQALRGNPTLAKYAIAYGAKAGNPMAANALRKCGITDAMMADKDAGVDKLVDFLEARFSEDLIILRDVAKGKWYPGPVELTAASWLDFVTAAEDEAKLAPLPTSPLVLAAMTTLEEDRKAFDAAGDNATLRQAQLTLARLVSTRKVIAGIAPKNKDGEAHEEFTGYLKRLEALMAAEVGRMTGMEKILASEKSTFDHIMKSFGPLRLEVMSLVPPQGSDFKRKHLAFSLSLDDLDRLSKGPDWAAALVAVKQAKVAANELLDLNLDLETNLRAEIAANADLVKLARDLQPETPTIVGLKVELNQLTQRIAAAQNAGDWGLALDLVARARDKANEILTPVP